MADPSRYPSPDDLLILLTVARLGRFNAVADSLGTTHTTVSRRISSLDKQLGARTLERTPHGWELTETGKQAVAAAEVIEERLGSLTTAIADESEALSGLVRVSTSDGFGAWLLTPALVKLQQRFPKLDVEMISATKKVSQNRSGVDLELVAGHVDITRAHPIHLTNYFLRLYATRAYLDTHGTPETADDLRHHNFISYVESVLQVRELGHGDSGLPAPASTFQSTNIFAQIEAVRGGCGIGLLPSFMISGQGEFVPVLREEFGREVTSWLVARPESLRSASVQAMIRAILGEAQARQDAFMS